MSTTAILMAAYVLGAITTCLLALIVWARESKQDAGDGAAAIFFGLVWPVVWLLFLPGAGLAWCINKATGREQEE